MMLHTGYLFGQDKNAPKTSDGRLCSPEGATFGIGGAARIHLWRLLRVGGEGFVSTMGSNTSNCKTLLQPGSYIRSGWGGINMDACWRDLPLVGKKQLWPYIGGAVGGGATRSFYLLEGNQHDWLPEQKSVFHKQAFCYIDPYIGFDACLSTKMHLTFRLDWMIALHKNQLVLPTGPRLYVGFMFTH